MQINQPVMLQDLAMAQLSMSRRGHRRRWRRRTLWHLPATHFA